MVWDSDCYSGSTAAKTHKNLDSVTAWMCLRRDTPVKLSDS